MNKRLNAFINGKKTGFLKAVCKEVLEANLFFSFAYDNVYYKYVQSFKIESNTFTAFYKPLKLNTFTLWRQATVILDRGFAFYIVTSTE